MTPRHFTHKGSKRKLGRKHILRMRDDEVFPQSPNPAIVSRPVTESLDVSHLLGIEALWIDYDGANKSMTADGDMFSYAWTPSVVGNATFTIYMESAIGTWSTVAGDFQVIPGGFDPMLLLIAAGGAAVVVVVIVAVVVKRRGSGE